MGLWRRDIPKLNDAATGDQRIGVLGHVLFFADLAWLAGRLARPNVDDVIGRRVGGAFECGEGKCQEQQDGA